MAIPMREKGTLDERVQGGSPDGVFISKAEKCFPVNLLGLGYPCQAVMKSDRSHGGDRVR